MSKRARQKAVRASERSRRERQREAGELVLAAFHERESARQDEAQRRADHLERMYRRCGWWRQHSYSLEKILEERASRLVDVIAYNLRFHLHRGDRGDAYYGRWLRWRNKIIDSYATLDNGAAFCRDDYGV